MAQLITKAEIQALWPMSLNMDDARVLPWIQRAQENELQYILGPELYFALNAATIVPGDRFDELLNGADYIYNPPYERQFKGVKELLAAYAFNKIVENNPTFVTRGGVMHKGGDDTINATTKEVNDRAQNVYSEAIRLEQSFYDFMGIEGFNYPEWQFNGPAKKGAFNFFNASRGCTKYELGPDFWEYKNPLG